MDTSPITAYIDSISDERRQLLLTLKDMILTAYPEAEARIAYHILMYKIPTGWVGLGYRKDGVTLYSEAISAISAFKAKHPKIKTGKGCLNFRLTDTIPYADVQKVISAAMMVKQ